MCFVIVKSCKVHGKGLLLHTFLKKRMYEFDIKTLLKTLWNARRRIVINCFISLLAGIVIAFSIPKEYVASCTLASEVQSEEVGGGLSSLLSMTGLSGLKSSDAIGPDLYPSVVASRSFLVDLLYVEVETEEGEHLSYYDYLKTKTRMPWWGFVSKAIGKALHSILPDKEKKSTRKGERIDPEHMTREEEALVEGLKGLVGCKINEKDYTINLTVRAQDPNVPKVMVDTLMAHLQSFITAYRTNKVRNDLYYYQKLEVEANQKYLETQQAYADYCDSHQGIILQAYQTELERLENDLQIAISAYTQVKQHVQMAEAKVQEKTPAFTLIEKSTVPNRPVSPKKLLMLMGFLFLGFMGTCGWLYVKLLFFTQREKQ